MGRGSRRWRIIATAVVVVLAVIAAACGGGTQTPAETGDDNGGDARTAVQLELATFQEGSAWYVYGATLAEQLQQRLPSGSRVHVRPYAGGIGNPELLQKGEADLAFNFTVNARWAYDGAIVYDTPHDRLRGVVGGLDEYFVAVMAREGLQIESLADIAEQQLGINLFTLSAGSQGEVVTRLLFEAYGFDYDDIRSWGGSVEHTTFDVISSAFRDGRADIFIHNITPGHPTVTEIAVTSGLQFIPLEEAIAAPIAEANGMRVVELPADSFPGQPEPVLTLGWNTALTAHADLPDWVAYEVARTFVEQRDAFVEAHQSLSYFQPENAADPTQLGVPLHPGAEAYYREAGLLHE